MIKLIIGVIVVAAIALVGFMAIDPNVNFGIYAETSEVSDTNTTSFKVTIEGEVNAPATYVLKDGATMSDLIDAADGVTKNADPLAYYETAELTKGKTYYIASKFDSNDVCYTTELTKVNINSDNAETLSSIDGISNSVASSIVSYRAENGNFETIEQLLEVYGVGNATYRKIRNYVILHE